jgi:methylmalonyl-CoA mutase N-terminal domain/subunit
VANTVDPVGGSYAIEDLTNRLEADAMALLTRIDAAGGTLAAIESGFIQQQIQDSAYTAQQAVDAGAAIVVGVNRYVDEDARARAAIFRVDPAIEARQVERVRALRASRHQDEWRTAIARVERAAREGDNLVPHVIHAVEHQATVGEISDALRRVFGEYRES